MVTGVQTCALPIFSLDVLDLPSRALRLTRSLTSGLTRCASDPAGVFWGVGDRGPNLKPKAALELYGVAAMRQHLNSEGAKLFPVPAIGPSLARFRIASARQPSRGNRTSARARWFCAGRAG